MENKVIPRFWIFSLFLAAIVFVFIACQLTQSEKTIQSLSFNKMYDSLAQYDSIQITLKDTSGNTIDIIYKGKVDTIAEITRLTAPNWDGGIVLVNIFGYRNGELVYYVYRKFDGTTDIILDTANIILPNTMLLTETISLQMQVGDSIPFPLVTVLPTELKEKSIKWTSSNPTIFSIMIAGLKANKQGTAQLTATLNSNPSKTISLAVLVLQNASIPESLSIVPDSLVLAAGGSPAKVYSRVIPLSANSLVKWGILDSSIASITADGIVQGLKQGATELWSKSIGNPNLTDTIPVSVSGPVSVEKVSFRKDSIDLFIGGASESLPVDILPSKANQGVNFLVVDSTLVWLFNGQVRGTAPGTTQIIANSIVNPIKADTLKVTVFRSQRIDSVRVKPDSLKLFTGGTGFNLLGKVYPDSAIPALQWSSLNTAIALVDAEGRVAPVATGKTLVVATSRVDSAKHDTVFVNVVKDPPQVLVGLDTVVSVGATLAFKPLVTQEFGKVIQFKWDVNGDKTWDGSADSVISVTSLYDKAGEYGIGFFIKDTEGNETTVFKKVKVVQGPAVNILSPKDSSYTNAFLIDVSWSVNGNAQDSLLKQALKLGVNLVTRSAKDEAGQVFSSSITVFLDTTAPAKPVVRGPVSTATRLPTWIWAGGGLSGAGVFKVWMDAEDPTLAKEIKDTTFTPVTELSETVHTLFVIERDQAGNWSQPGRFSIKIDLSGPMEPKVSVTPASPTNSRKPKWSWVSGGAGGKGSYRFKLDNSSLELGATNTTDTVYVPANTLSNGAHVLYVQEQDSAGNWSPSGSAAIVIDTIAPSAPIVTSSSTTPTNNTQPAWNWTSGGIGGKGFYRYKLGDTLWATGGFQGNVTSYQPATALAEGVRTLFVEEQDSAGNWSGVGSFALTLDFTPPGAPKMDSTPYSPLNSLKPTWTWVTGGGGSGTFRCKLDNSDMNSGTTTVTSGSYTPSSDQTEGRHTLFVQEKDGAGTGNWSPVSSRSIVVALRKPIGSAGFVACGYSPLYSAISKAGEIYTSSADNLDSGKAKVMKYNGTAWVQVGKNGLGLGVYGPLQIAVSESGIPHVVYVEPYKVGSLDNYKASVARFNGEVWLPVGNAAFSEGMASNLVLAFSSTGTPYVAFKDDANESKLSVMRLIGPTWAYVGGPGISLGSIDAINIAVSGSGTPYVVFVDQFGPTKNTVMGYLNNAWSNLGDLDPFGGVGSIAINKAGIPYFAFRSNAFGSKATVVKWNGSGFETVGNGGFSDDQVGQISLTFGSNDNLYAGFDDHFTPNPGGSSSKPSVMRLEGGKWVPVGPQRISQGTGTSTTMVLDQNDVPIVTFVDEFLDRKGTVMKASFDP